mmetsp:Transcript_5403/g.7929  ORF Transcript_5403/g.7929 Transcript_5403/m.7929 type:complete len:343 (-) Transcript_5403:118-1146(-)|eukprot:CAMPEP_0116035664 /NCGR_PEP_ID=MMETSP0321-20121206/20545_1 /TAXON_ID=163516 /ORGANISM="Leptocylindrus danicus var. danicus, Strain B650" /LENGTH=342 /DNA_ID=CAMNT_0003512625 /DNA_START=153 /DNA_END=1181 /DNA_ORIENTATION=-
MSTPTRAALSTNLARSNHGAEVTTPKRSISKSSHCDKTPIASVKKNKFHSNHAPMSPLHPPKSVEENSEKMRTEHENKIFSPTLNATNSQEEHNNVNAHLQVPHLEEPNDNSMDDDEDDDAECSEEEFNPYYFMKHVPPRPRHLLKNLPILPPKSANAPAHTLVLDLDETLVHCTVDSDQCPNPDLTFTVEFNSQEYVVFVKQRPYLLEFLKRVSKKFEVIIFTASQRVYANALLNLIDPDQTLIQHRMFRESCLPIEGNYLKDLAVLGPSRPLERAILVDNSPHAFSYNVDNGVPIESWFDNLHDTELMKLELFLDHLLLEEDVRGVIRRTFNVRDKIARA